MYAMLTLARLDDRAVLAVTGPDARPFLHNLLTQNVEALEPGALRYAALLTPQGRLLHDLFLWGQADGVRLDVAASARDDLLRRLTLYRLRAKVQIEPTDEAVFAEWLPFPLPGPGGGGRPQDASGSPETSTPTPPRKGEGLRCVDPRSRDLGWRALGSSPPPEAELADAQAYDRHRLRHGVPDAARDGLSDRAYPIEADLDLLGAIDFKKGCFIGQETTSRMHRRGQVKTRLLPLVVEAAAPGAEVLAGQLRAGEVTYAQGDRALALLRLDRVAGAALTVDGRPARVDPPAWFPQALATAPVAPAG
jgi:hypothetical protein